MIQISIQKMTYQKDTYERVELYVYKETNTLLQADIRNFKEPEGSIKAVSVQKYRRL